jgi:hypothetical protein
MRNYDNNNRGSIWKNDKKEKDTHPDFTGSLNVNGVEYWVSAWKRKEGAAPKAPALSFSVKPKEEQQPTAARRPDPISTGRQLPPKQNILPNDDTDIPF